MKNFFAFFLFVSTLVLFSCGSDSSSSNEDTTSTTPPATTTPATTTSQPANNSGVEHYTCPEGHVGKGGPAAGKCSQCGAELVHNQAFHAGQQTPPPITGETGASATLSTGDGETQQNIQVTPPPPGQPEPAQNANGVWHFTCAKGCEGGAGAIGPCPKCGEQLAHNQAYHQ